MRTQGTVPGARGVERARILDRVPSAARSRRFGRLFTFAGAVLAVFGAIPWLVHLSGAASGDDAMLLVLATVAIVGGAFVALMGVGLVRQVDALRRAGDERRLDEAVLAAAAAAEAAPDCATPCRTCTASCVLGYSSGGSASRP
jgi:hypothetical protein